MNPLEQCIQSAVRANGAIGNSFARIGTKEHPRGFVMSAYRNASRALAQGLREENRETAAAEALYGMRRQLEADLMSELGDMWNYGEEEAARQLMFYGMEAVRPMGYSEQAQEAVNVCLAKVDTQIQTTRALILTGQDDLVLGDDGRGGAVRWSDVSGAAAFWTSAMVAAGFNFVMSAQAGHSFQKQVIAALDGKTTECCLMAHGQIRPFEKPFDLSGTPRFADKMDWPGFHWYCRTAVALYNPVFDDGLTARMRQGADDFMAARAAGLNPDPHPANAYWENR